MRRVSLPPGWEIKRRSLDLFRKSTGPPSSQTESEPSFRDDVDAKKTRFSMFSGSERRSSFVFEPLFFDNSMIASPWSASPMTDEPSSLYTSDMPDTESIEMTDARRHALEVLEGRIPHSQAQSRPASLGMRSRPTSMTIPSPIRNALHLTQGKKSRSGSGSVGSRRSNDQRRPSSRLGRVPENEDAAIPAAPVAARLSITVREEVESGPQPREGFSGGEMGQERAHAPETDEHEQAGYAAAGVSPSHPTTYSFAQAGPFASTISAGEIAGLGQYHVSVGVNVWAPRSGVTTVSRGLTGDGPIVGQIESGHTSSVSPTLIVGDMCRPVEEVLSKDLTDGSRTYHVEEGVNIVWKLDQNQWKAYINARVVAAFCPHPPRSLVVEPLGQKYLDHILLGSMLLVRQTDAEGFGRPDDPLAAMPLPFM